MAFNPTIPAYSTQGKSFSRTAAFPLEGYEIWTDLDALIAYAANTDPAKDPSYIGQKVAYIDTKNSRVVHYGIEIDGTLKELGADKMGVEELTAADEGKVPQAFKVIDIEESGFEEEGNYQPEVSHIEIRWVTIEGDNTITTITSEDGSVTVTDSGSDGNHIYDLKVNFPDGVEVPEYAIKKLDEPTEGSQATYRLTKDGENVDVAIEIPEQVDYTVTCEDTDHEATDEAPAFKRHTLKQLGETICTIDVPKELVVESGSVIVATVEDVTEDNGVIIGETYIKLVIANQVEPIYIPAKALVDEYTGTSTTTAKIAVDNEKYTITADVNVSAEENNVLTVKNDGLYVNLPTVEDAEVEHQVVVAVAQENGAISVTRKQLSYNDLTDLPSALNLELGETEELSAAENATIAVIAELGVSGHTITPKTIEVASKKGLDDLAALVGQPADNQGTVANGLHGAVAELGLALEGKVNISDAIGENEDGIRFINQTEINKLAALNLDGNEITISGSVNASQVKELDPRIVAMVTGTGDYVITEAQGDPESDDYIPAVMGKQLGIERGAQVNKIEAIALPDAVLAINEKQVNIPYATDTLAGVVVGKKATNKIFYEVDEEGNSTGVGEVYSLSTDKLVNGDEELILFGGGAINA